VLNTKNVDSKEIQTFIEDVRDDLKNIDDIINYYDFLGHHNIRSMFLILKMIQVFLRDP